MKKFSILECFDIETGERTVLHEFEGTIEAPNWLSDGKHILYNSEGRIWSYDICTQESKPVDTGYCICCNNDHIPSPDGKRLGISDSPVVDGKWTSRIWVVPLKVGSQEQDEKTAGNTCDLNGDVPRQVTVNSPSYLHGWSHDGLEMAYCAFRGEKIDIYTISPEGGAERRLTDGIGYNDGPEYSPDDRHIWFNSTRAGLMQIFRMNRDGSHVTQMTDNDSNNWFAHVSPDGQKVVYLSFRKEDLEPWQHLPDKQVTLWLMDYDGGGRRQIAEVFGGQGTINVNSWAPESRRFAFVSYRYE